MAAFFLLLARTWIKLGHRKEKTRNLENACFPFSTEMASNLLAMASNLIAIPTSGGGWQLVPFANMFLQQRTFSGSPKKAIEDWKGWLVWHRFISVLRCVHRTINVVLACGVGAGGRASLVKRDLNRLRVAELLAERF